MQDQASVLEGERISPLVFFLLFNFRPFPNPSRPGDLPSSAPTPAPVVLAPRRPCSILGSGPLPRGWEGDAPRPLTG